MGKFNLSLHLRQFPDIRRVNDIRFRIQDIKNSFRRRQICHQIIVKITEIHNRVPEHIDVCTKCNQQSDRHFLKSEETHAYKIKHHRTKSPTEVDDRSEHIRVPHRIHKGLLMFIGQISENLPCLILRTKALHDIHARNILVHISIQIRGFLTENLPTLMRRRLHEPNAQRHHRNGRKRR